MELEYCLHSSESIDPILYVMEEHGEWMFLEPQWTDVLPCWFEMSTSDEAARHVGENLDELRLTAANQVGAFLRTHGCGGGSSRRAQQLHNAHLTRCLFWLFRFGP